MVSPATQTQIPQAHTSPFTTHESTDLFSLPRKHSSKWKS